MIFDTSARGGIYGWYDLDAIDQKIIGFLQINGREPFAKIAEEIGVPPSTVRDRTNRMIESGVLQIVAQVKPNQARKQVMASVGIKLATGKHREVAADLARLDEISYLVIGTGRFDLQVELTCQDNTHLLEIISAIQDMPQVQHTESFVYFAIVKNDLAGGATAF